MKLCPMNTQVARQEVRQFSGLENLRDAATATLSSDSPDPNLLKIIEYAMLIEPISYGVEQLVRKPVSSTENPAAEGCMWRMQLVELWQKLSRMKSMEGLIAN